MYEQIIHTSLKTVNVTFFFLSFLFCCGRNNLENELSFLSSNVVALAGCSAGL